MIFREAHNMPNFESPLSTAEHMLVNGSSVYTNYLNMFSRLVNHYFYLHKYNYSYYLDLSNVYEDARMRRKLGKPNCNWHCLDHLPFLTRCVSCELWIIRHFQHYHLMECNYCFHRHHPIYLLIVSNLLLNFYQNDMHHIVKT